MNRNERLANVRSALLAVKDALLAIYGDRLVNVILYGSFARGEFKEDSDIDVAVILKGEVNKGREIDRVYDSLYDLELQTGELVSVYPISREEFERSIWPLFYHIRNEGVVVGDRYHRPPCL